MLEMIAISLLIPFVAFAALGLFAILTLWLPKFIRLRRRVLSARDAVDHSDEFRRAALTSAYNGLAIRYNQALNGFPGVFARLLLGRATLLPSPQTPLSEREQNESADNPLKIIHDREPELRRFHQHLATTPALQELERRRKRLVGIFRKTIIAAIISPLLISTILWASPWVEFDIAVLMPCSVASLAFFSWLYKKQSGGLTKDYEQSFRTQVLTPLIDHINPNLDYTPNQSISSGILKESLLLEHAKITEDSQSVLLTEERREQWRKGRENGQGIKELFMDLMKHTGLDKYRSKDLVRATGGPWRFEMACFRVLREEAVTRGRNRDHEICQGLLLYGENPLPVKDTVILLDAADALEVSRNPTRLTRYQGREEAVFDDAEFDRAFAVYAHDPIEAHRLLSARVRQALLEWRKQFAWRFRLSFIADQLYMIVEDKGEVFSPPRKSTLLDYSAFQDRIRCLSLLQSLPASLGLKNEITESSVL